MSSTTMQSVPHQSTSVSTNSPMAALSSGRPFTSSTSQSRESYYAHPSTNASPSSRKSSRRPSGANTISTNYNTSPSYHRVTMSSPTPSTGNRISSLSASTSGAPQRSSTMSPGDLQLGLPPVVSPRTSSNRAPHSTIAIIDRSTSRKVGHRETSNSPRPTTSSDCHHARDRSKNNQNTSQLYWTGEDRSSTASKGRKNGKPQEANPEPMTENRERKAPANSSNRRKNGTLLGTKSTSGPSREASEVLNRIVISHPEVDIERERERMAEAVPISQGTPVSATASESGTKITTTRTTRSRHDFTTNTAKREKNIKFGEYYLGGTLGEGEFGKVKMGWKQEGGVQVAIKLIRRDSVGTNPSRLAKIYREIAILREISHPNIVRLHEMVETEKQIGIILEYASGGELFDFILNNRYLNDNSARRLFAQLISGVGYLHKKGIVHRDLKLENLLLDRNCNIIITDFGFANTFNADDELNEEIEYNLGNKEYVKHAELDKILPGGYRRGDLMQTSCGSPCYAAPELVVSDSLYTGRKVDVWSCGVILYAMLAGYLPFDDDPANPEGDNINLLYRYIVSTPLTFPEYVSPHARDLLRRILVPDPRKRADLFEVARHSWLAEYEHVVNFITSRALPTREIPLATLRMESKQESPLLFRSASVREPSKNQKPVTTNGELPKKYGKTDLELNEPRKTSKDNKRRTVQVEYVAPRSQTQRVIRTPEITVGPTSSEPKKRVSSGSHAQVVSTSSAAPEKSVLYDSLKEIASTIHVRRPSTAKRQQIIPQPTRREHPNSISESGHHFPSQPHPPVSLTRPTTGGSIKSFGSRPASMQLSSRTSYSQPLAPELAGTNVQGRMAQPKSINPSCYESPVETDRNSLRESEITDARSKSSRVLGVNEVNKQPIPQSKELKTAHRRSNTFGGFFSRTNSVFGVGGGRRSSEQKHGKKYPPVSMSATAVPKDETPRQSVDSRRSVSFNFARKRSGSISKSQVNILHEKPRRYSLLPTFSFKAIGIGKDASNSDNNYYVKMSQNIVEDIDLPRTAPIRPTRLYSATGTSTPISFVDGPFERSSEILVQTNQHNDATRGEKLSNQASTQQQNPPPVAFRPGRFGEPEPCIIESIKNPSSEVRESQSTPSQQSLTKSTNGRGVLQKNNRRFADAYDKEVVNGYGNTHSDHAGSSGAARKVMDFFRRRGRDRGL